MCNSSEIKSLVNYFLVGYKYMTIFSLIFFIIADKSTCLIFTYWYLQQQMCLIWFCVLFHLSVLKKLILMRRGEYMFWWLKWKREFDSLNEAKHISWINCWNAYWVIHRSDLSHPPFLLISSGEELLMRVSKLNMVSHKLHFDIHCRTSIK